MKNQLLSLILFALAFTSCTKEIEQIQPKKQLVTYKLSCTDCLITFETDKWNKSNSIPTSQYQYSNVTGSFEYSFENTNMDSVEINLYVGVFGPYQKIDFEATESLHNKSIKYDGYLGFGPNPLENYPLEKKLIFLLK